jgi:uncharacterized protein (TIRG00374 family)
VTEARKHPINVGKIVAVMMVAVGLYFGYALWTGFDKVGADLARFRWEFFAAACGLAFGNYLVRFLKWEFYLAKLDITGVGKIDSLLTFFSGFVLTVTPGKVGEMFKSLVLDETHGVPAAKTAPIVVAERVTDVIGITVLIVLGSLGFHGGLVLAAIGAGLVLVLLAIVASRKLSMGMIGFVERLPGRFGKMAPKLRTAYESLAVLVKPANLVWPTLLSIVAWSLECMSLAVVLRGFGANVSLELCTFFYATSTLAGAIIPVPGGLGVTETSLKGQMQEFGGVSSETSTGAMILVRFATLWFAVLVGFVSLTLLKRRYPSLLRAPAGNPVAEEPRSASADSA